MYGNVRDFSVVPYAKMEHVSEDERELCKLELVKRAVDLLRQDTRAPEMMDTEDDHGLEEYLLDIVEA
ncbi:unnamed protein product [Phytophthora lilii]|uniref:Unnamed protein product n=1 Tax=Phytophthora lilii TaxID=2077276 RepID=A0A9W6WGX9_9STRA|nr:unnamed protein product [Phytophthora lilii]